MSRYDPLDRSLETDKEYGSLKAICHLGAHICCLFSFADLSVNKAHQSVHPSVSSNWGPWSLVPGIPYQTCEHLRWLLQGIPIIRLLHPYFWILCAKVQFSLYNQHTYQSITIQDIDLIFILKMQNAKTFYCTSKM